MVFSKDAEYPAGLHLLWVVVFILAAIVLLTTLFCETAARRGWLPYWISRKVLHLVAVGCCAVAGAMVEVRLLVPIVLVAEVGLIYLVSTGKVMRDETGRRPWGILWFPLAFLVLLLNVSPNVTFYSMAILAVCDPAAAIVGRAWPWLPYNLTGDGKTVGGSLGFLVVFLVLCFGLNFGLSWSEAFTLGFLLALIEGLGSKGLDNLAIPLFAGWCFYSWNSISDITQWQLVTFLILVGLPFTWLMRKKGKLTVGAGIAAIFLAYIIIPVASGQWLLPLLVFFLSSSVLERVFPSSNTATDEKQDQPRDVTQVLANGGIYAFVCIGVSFSGIPFYHIGYQWENILLVAAAVATADTWSSTVGQYFRQPTFDILYFRKVEPGLSGGVSWSGTVAGLLGAALISSLGYLLITRYNFRLFLIITAFGFAGMLLDSVLGSALQVKYSQDNILLDRPLASAKQVRGLAYVTNDVVNVLAIAVTTGIFTYFFFEIMALARYFE